VNGFSQGAWSGAQTLNSGTPVGGPAVVALAGNNNLVAVWGEPGVMQYRTDASSVWSLALSLPASTSTGAVNESAVARASNGHALAVWTQADANSGRLFAAEYNGTSWSAPVSLGQTGFFGGLGALGSPTVAANANGFVVGWVNNSIRYVAPWNGSGIGTPVSLGSIGAYSSQTLRLASDGTTAVAVWDDGPAFNMVSLWSSTSVTGSGWTAAQQVEPPDGWATIGIAGGPEGVLEWANDNRSATLSARVWHAGGWSAAAPVSAQPCAGAVAASSALIACGNGAASLNAAQFAGGSWTNVPPGSTGLSGIYEVAVATDGTDYRLDAWNQSSTQSQLFHAGSWSTAASDSSVTIGYNSGTAASAGACGNYVLAYTNSTSTSLTRATGGAAYPAGSAIAPQPFGSGNVRFASWPGVTDAWWTAPSTTSKGVPVLYVALGL
jgi:hypothetical protein